MNCAYRLIIRKMMILVMHNSKVLNKETTEKLVYNYSNWKAVALAARDDERKIFTWDND